MKKVLGIVLGLLFVVAVVATGVFLYRKSQVKPVVYQTASPTRTDLVKKTVATGAVVPRKEVLVKPLISGIIEELYVEAGQQVKQGDLIAKVRVIPNMVSLSNAESRVNKARIALADAEREYHRNQTLASDGTIAQADFQKAEIAFEQAKEEVKAAEDNLDIVRKGTSQRVAAASTTIVKSTLTGTVLEVPLEVGNSVIEANNFNDGTTIAAVADMDDMIFEGKVDESEVGKIRTGMELQLTIGAIPDKRIRATLEHIAPKGKEENGAIQFEIRAAVKLKEGQSLRSGYSANADIELDRRDSVLSVPESIVSFNAKGDSAFVFVKDPAANGKGEDAWKKTWIKTGLSDGINLEVLQGVEAGTELKGARKEDPKEVIEASVGSE